MFESGKEDSHPLCLMLVVDSFYVDNTVCMVFQVFI